MYQQSKQEESKHAQRKMTSAVQASKRKGNNNGDMFQQCKRWGKRKENRDMFQQCEQLRKENKGSSSSACV